MTRYLASILIVFSVIITIQERVTIKCMPQIKLLKRGDGIYEKVINITNPMYCEDTIETKEEWTDYPEKSGKFIREIK